MLTKAIHHADNRSHIYILSDGNVTVCEQMYWKERFIIGNILENSIEKIWNSPSAPS